MGITFGDAIFIFRLTSLLSDLRRANFFPKSALTGDINIDTIQSCLGFKTS